MGRKKATVLETGQFASPSLHADGPYELLQQPSGELVVKCVMSGTTHDVSILAVPTQADVEAQKRAFIRELAAWLSTNGPNNPAREQLAVAEVSKALQASYTTTDLANDREWIKSNDLSKRVKILKQGLSSAQHLELVEFAARIAAAGTGVSETDARFIEILGAGLGLSRDITTNAVVSAIQTPAAA